MNNQFASDEGEDSFFANGEKGNQKVLFGAGTVNQVGILAGELGKNVLLVTDSGLSTVGHPQKVKAFLEQSDLNVTLFDRSIENPTESSVQACVQVASKAQVDLIIGLGGGSSMDTAKDVISFSVMEERCQIIGVLIKPIIRCFLCWPFQPLPVREVNASHLL